MLRRHALAVMAAVGFLGCHPALGHEYKAGALTIEHPWSRATPPGAKVAAGYFVVSNSGTAPDRLVSATAEVSDKVEIHQSLMQEGVATMRPVPGGVEVPAGGSVAFKPDSFHLMMTRLKHPLKQKDHVPGALVFEKAGRVAVEFAVEAAGSTPDMSAMPGMSGMGN